MKSRSLAVAISLGLAVIASNATAGSAPLVCLNADGTRRADCPPFLTVTDWGDICTVYHDGARSRGFGCTEIAPDGALSCQQVHCTIGAMEMGCDGPYFGDRPCDGHQELVDELELFSLINEERAQEDLPAVEYHPIASNVVEEYAEYVCARGGCARGENCHRLDGSSGGDRLREEGIRWRRWCENLAFGRMGPQGALDLWMDSAGHRDCILDDEVTQAGVAYVDCAGAPDTWIMIQLAPAAYKSARRPRPRPMLMSAGARGFN
jgi:hypothetical protein